MVRVPGGTDAGLVDPRSVGDFWIDRYDVINREFKRFVDAGGYENPQYWKQPFVRRLASLADVLKRPNQSREGCLTVAAQPRRRTQFPHTKPDSTGAMSAV